MGRTILVTGGAGYIGSNFVLQRIAAGDHVITFDKLNYAGSLANLASLDGHPAHLFVHGGIEDEPLLRMLLLAHRPDAIVNFAAESCLERSVADPEEFLFANVVGTLRLLQQSLAYYRSLAGDRQSHFRFLHVSNEGDDGPPGPADPASDESDPPNSSYSASKASADQLVRAYRHTYGLPTLTTNCSNNYGPYQLPEKLIPSMILNALHGKPLPVYGDGLNVRDWLYVGDHCDAISLVVERGSVGETYHIGGDSEKTTLEVVTTICSIMDELHPEGAPHSRLIEFVKDRPGRDRHCAMDASKLQRELGWRPRESFASGIRRTIEWYLSNAAWIEQVTSGGYRQCIAASYESRDPEVHSSEARSSESSDCEGSDSRGPVPRSEAKDIG